MNGRVFISSQNHGYAVVSESIDPEKGEELFVNVNDGTCEVMSLADTFEMALMLSLIHI